MSAQPSQNRMSSLCLPKTCVERLEVVYQLSQDFVVGLHLVLVVQGSVEDRFRILELEFWELV